MFERYTEKARRVIFFTPYEASQSALLGLLREDRALMKRFLGETDFESQIRTEIERHITICERISVFVDVPLTAECAKILGFAAEEADRLGHRRVGTEHLLLGMLRMEGSLAAQILQGRGLKLAATREQLPKIMGAGIKTQGQTGPLPKLENFLSGLKTYGAEELLPFLQKMRISWTPQERSGIAKRLTSTLQPYLFCTPRKTQLT